MQIVINIGKVPTVNGIDISLEDLNNADFIAQQDLITYAVEYPAAYAMAFQEQVEEFFEHLVCFLNICFVVHYLVLIIIIIQIIVIVIIILFLFLFLFLLLFVRIYSK